MEHITIKEVAKLCGVGVSTVSRAINNHPDINPETKQKILDAIREYNYVPNNSARNLKRADSNTIAVIIKEISNSYWGVMLHVLEREVRDSKYCLVLQNVADDEDEVEIAIQLEKEKKEASDDEKLSYTTQIQTAQTDIKKTEYEKKSKSVEIEQMKEQLSLIHI